MVDMPNDLAARLLFDDCEMMLSHIEYRNSNRIADMLVWLNETYCYGVPPLRAAEVHQWALECSQIGGVELVWLSIKAGALSQN